MNIVHAVDHLDAPGGIQSYIRRVASAQQARGDRVAILDLRSAEQHELEPQIVGGVEVFVRSRSMWTRGLDDVVSQADVIHVHHMDLPNGLEADDRVVVHFHGHQPYCSSGSKYFAAGDRPCDVTASTISCAKGKLFQRCGSVRLGKVLEGHRATRHFQHLLGRFRSIMISQYCLDELRAVGADCGNVFVVTPPIDGLPSPAERRDPCNALFVGRISRLKGLRWFLEAVADMPELIIDVVGDGEERAALETRYGGATRRFHGWIDPSDVATRYANAGFAVVPSTWHEPFGLVMIEAMAYGLPVIASRVGGMTEVVEASGGGVLVTPGDPIELRAAISTLLDPRGRGADLGAAGRAWVLSHATLEHHLAALDAIYGQRDG
jgi:glycosyltransferase involved in cell wall biosynthesis